MTQQEQESGPGTGVLPKPREAGSVRPAVVLIAGVLALGAVVGVRWLTGGSDSAPSTDSALVAPAPQPAAPSAIGENAPEASSRDARRLARERSRESKNRSMTGEGRPARSGDPAADARANAAPTGVLEPELVDRVRRERDPDERIEAIRSLVEAGGSASLPLLDEILRTDGNVDVRLAVVESLPDTAAIDAPPEARPYIDLLLAALRDPSADVREAAGYLLGFEEDEKIPAALRDAYGAEADENVRDTIGDSLEFVGGELPESADEGSEDD